MKNEWRVVKGFPLYEVSNEGNVRKIKDGKHLKVNGGRVYLFLNTKTKEKRTRSVSTLMRENWTWEWIKDIEDGEEFKECVGFPGYYVSNRGRVFSMESYSFLTPVHSHSYYWVINLGGQKSKNTPLHTLVGRTHLDWEEGDLILHNEETLPFPEINWVENLRVGDWSDNNQDTWDKDRQPCRVSH